MQRNPIFIASVVFLLSSTLLAAPSALARNSGPDACTEALSLPAPINLLPFPQAIRELEGRVRSEKLELMQLQALSEDLQMTLRAAQKDLSWIEKLKIRPLVGSLGGDLAKLDTIDDASALLQGTYKRIQELKDTMQAPEKAVVEATQIWLLATNESFRKIKGIERDLLAAVCKGEQCLLTINKTLDVAAHVEADNRFNIRMDNVLSGIFTDTDVKAYSQGLLEILQLVQVYKTEIEKLKTDILPESLGAMVEPGTDLKVLRERVQKVQDLLKAVLKGVQNDIDSRVCDVRASCLAP